ncbi:Anp1-domain-containing protein [Chlamydoabsidia padenii]|nr:Anp1-domain-containing protein [Chlamydoabsidia padenii]
MPSDTDKRQTPILDIKKRSLTVLIGLVLLWGLTYTILSNSTADCDDTYLYPTNNNGNIIDTVQQLSAPSDQQRKQLEQISFQNLNNNDTTMVVVMVVLPPWAVSSSSLDTFFKQLDRQTHSTTRLALLVLNPPSPTTIYTVRHHLPKRWRVDLYTKTYDSLTPWIATDDHHDDTNTIYELAPLRKSAMARAKNFLLQSALEPTDGYVLWLDPLLVDFPPTMIKDFIGLQDDILVPNTMIGNDVKYDRSNWQETPMSISLQENVPMDFVFMEGWWEYDTHRFLMVDMVSDDNDEQIFTKVPLDGVGSTCLFVKAEIHRNGLNFPPYPYQHQLDSEAFAKIAKLEGYNIVGLPNYKIYHTNVDSNSNSDDDNNDIDNDDDNDDNL